MRHSILAVLLAALVSCGKGESGESKAPAPPPAPVGLTGPQLYEKWCQSCHGAKGEGGKDYPEPLVGDRSLEKLSVYVRKKMPEDKPGVLKVDEAERVSKYIYDAFYSKAAQARRDPPRMELSRLTVGQYKTSVADLMSMFSTAPAADAKPGLRQEIFNAGRRMRDDKRINDNRVATLDYHPGDKPPPELAALEE